MRLEDRIVLDAAGAAAGDTPDNDATRPDAIGTDSRRDTAPSDARDAADAARILLIDDSVDQAQALADAALADVIRLETEGAAADLDAILANARDALDGRRAEHIAIASHGAEGAFGLGSHLVNSDTLQIPEMQAFWRGLAAMVQGDGRIDLLACDVAGGETGPALVAELESLTERDIAASDNDTGSAALGGDWVLETHGVDVAADYFDVQALANFGALLPNDPVQITVPTWPSIPITAPYDFGGAIGIADGDAGDTITVELSVTRGTLHLSGTTGLTFTAGADATSAMTFEGVLADVNAALNGLDFDPDDGYNGTASLRIRAADGVGSDDYNAVSILVDWPVNNAPHAGDTSATFDTIAEDPATNNGTSIGDLLASIAGGVDDNDDGPPGEGLLGIAITSDFAMGQGTFEYTVDGGNTWTSTAGASAANAILLGDFPDTAVRFVPNADLNTTNWAFPANIAFRVWDMSTGLHGGTGNASASGDPTAFSAASINAAPVVTQVNDAPVNTVPGAQGLAEDTVLTFTGGTLISIADVDAAAPEGDGTLEVTLTAANGTLTLSQTTGLAFPTGDGTADATMTFNGVIGDINAALDGLTFTPTAEFSGAASVQILTSDRGQIGSGGTQTDTDTVNITISAENDAPVLDASGAMVLATVDEDDTGNNGTTVQAIIDSSAANGGDAITDIDGVGEGMAIAAVTNTNGTWQYKVGAGAWNGIAAVADNNALLLASTDRVRFVPNADYNGAATGGITFRAWDGSAGVAGATADTTVNGGTSPYSTATETASVTVNAVNDAPVLDNTSAPALPAVNEDAGPSVAQTVGDIVINGSIAETPADEVAVEAIAVTGADNSNGMWQYKIGAGPWMNMVGLSESAALLMDTTDQIRFIPDPDYSGAATFSYRAWDKSGGAAGMTLNVTANGGTTPFSAAGESASITVNPVNDAPTSVSASNTIVQENDAGAVVGTLTAADVDPGDTHTFTLQADPTGKFEIVGSQLKLIDGQFLDYAATPVVALTVRADDGNGGTYDQALSITVAPDVATGGPSDPPGGPGDPVDDPGTPTDPTPPGDPPVDDTGGPGGPPVIDPPPADDLTGDDTNADATTNTGGPSAATHREEEMLAEATAPLDTFAALDVTRAMPVDEELLLGDDQPEEIRHAYTTILDLYAHSNEEMLPYLHSAFQAVVESASTYRCSAGVLALAQREITAHESAGLQPPRQLIALVRTVIASQDEVEAATAELTRCIREATRSISDEVDRFADDGIRAALENLNRANEHLILSFRALEAATNAAKHNRQAGDDAAARQSLTDAIDKARQSAREQIELIRKRWDRAAEDVLAACLRALAAKNGEAPVVGNVVTGDAQPVK